ncbi:uncharacterized protein LOC135166696 [Diachasmimorpha longicaudata]|uniref:uncharacterized protein LOC135166696 n=1 Tax=Diachasmimorpha longicaudata TaxID=58733 RepID=UPI0030B875D3
MAELETLDSTECLECSGPPPVFRLPPPPRPPFLTEGTFCSEAPLAELEDCVAIPMIDASYHTNPSLQNTALIITCAVVLLLMAAIVSVVFWKHKRKVQGLLPCKSAAAAAAAAAANRRNLGDGHTLQGTTTTGSGLLYEDLPETTPHSQLHNHLSVHNGPPTIEMLDVKEGGRGLFVCSSPGPDPYISQDLYNPVYEELNNGEHDTDEESELNARNRLNHYHHTHSRHHVSSSKPVSEDEFAEDELSLGEPSESKMLTSTRPMWSTCPTSSRLSRERRGKSPKSLDRRRKDKANDVGEFHEGMLLDALLQLYPNVAGVAGSRTSTSQRQKSVPSVAHKLPYFVPQIPVTQSVRVDENPYESVPVLGPLHHYTNQSKPNNKDKSRSANCTRERYPKCSQYGSEYFDLRNQDNTPPIYTQVDGDYSDSYAQPADRIYTDDKYEQPVYYMSRNNDQMTSGRLYQGLPDSSFGSDSGYSHHTSGTTGTNGTRSSITNINYNRKEKHRNSHHSHHSADFILS